MTAIESDVFSTDSTEEVAYRSISRTAVFALVLGGLGLLAFAGPLLIVLPLAGLGLAFASLYSFAYYPEELTGKPLAILALVLNSVLVVSTPIYHAYVYATEVPEGYKRIDFAALKSPAAVAYPEAPPPDDALKLDGQRIFVKGYVHQASFSSTTAKTFILVPDFATCCFGGQPPLTHMIEVDLTGDLTARASTKLIRLGGVLSVDKSLKPVSGLNGVYYQLRADYLK